MPSSATMNLTKNWAAVLDDYVIDLAWSPDDTRLAATSASGATGIFEKTTGAQLHRLPGHEDGANCLAWQPVPAGSPAVSLATGGQDGCVKFWDTLTGQHTATAALGTGWVEHLAWQPIREIPSERSEKPDNPKSQIPKKSQSPNPKSQNPEAPRAGDSLGLSSLPLRSEGISGLGICERRRVLAAACGRELVFLDPDASVRHRCPRAPKTISALAWQPAGGCLAAAYFGGVQLRDADDFIVQKEFPYSNGIQALVWSPDDRWLVSGNQDPSVHLWIPESGLELHMSGYEGKVKCLAFDPAARWLATGGGRDVCVWDCAGAGPEGREPLQLPHEAPLCVLAFQHRGSLLASASTDGVIMLWDLADGKPRRLAVVRMPSPATRLAWSADDAKLAIGCEKGALYVLAYDGGAAAAAECKMKNGK
jgi:WD40 repeat protein